jgi:hypothetical protein
MEQALGGFIHPQVTGLIALVFALGIVLIFAVYALASRFAVLR